jgi:hypothetical protein
MFNSFAFYQEHLHKLAAAVDPSTDIDTCNIYNDYNWNNKGGQ